MYQANSADSSRLRDIASALGTWSEETPCALRACMPAIAELLEGDKVFFHSLEPSSDGFSVSEAEGVGIDIVAFRSALQRVVTASGGQWAVYDPSRPAAWDRNRITSWERLRPHYPKEDPPVVKALFGPFRLTIEEQHRALVCEGPSMLGWFGGFWSRAPSARAMHAFRSLLPHVQRRTLLQRTLRVAPLLHAAMHASMDAIPAEAFLVSSGGTLLHANEAGRAAYERDRAGVGELLARLMRRGGASPVFTVTPIRARGVAPWFLVVRHQAADAPGRAGAVASRWGLTARQRDVLRLLARGDSNARIGAELGISDRTVEVHVAAIFEKAQVTSRAALVALVARLSDGT